MSFSDASPQWLETNGPEVVSPGASVTLRCKVQGSPPPRVTWTLRETTVDPNDPRMNVIRKVSQQFLQLTFVFSIYQKHLLLYQMNLLFPLKPKR